MVGEISARQALKAGASELKRVCEHIKQCYEQALPVAANKGDIQTVEGSDEHMSD